MVVAGPRPRDGNRRGDKSLKHCFTPASHPGEDVLEEYCLDRLDEREAAPVEEHLLVCETCRQRVTELDVFLKAAKQASRELRGEERYAGAETSWTWRLRPGWIAAGALAALTLAFLPSLRGPAEWKTVELSAVRGAEDGATGSVAEAAKPLRLNLDLAGIASEDCCLLELVSGDGTVLRQESAAPSGDRASIEQAQGLGRGQYWVRVRSKSGEDLREFGLTIR